MSHKKGLAGLGWQQQLSQQSVLAVAGVVAQGSEGRGGNDNDNIVIMERSLGPALVRLTVAGVQVVDLDVDHLTLLVTPYLTTIVWRLLSITFCCILWTRHNVITTISYSS